MNNTIDIRLENIAKTNSALKYRDLKILYYYIREREGDSLKLSTMLIMFPFFREEEIRSNLKALEKEGLISLIVKENLENNKQIRGYRYLVSNSSRSRLDINIMHSLLKEGFSLSLGIYKKKKISIIARKSGVSIAFFFEGEYTITQIAKIPFHGVKCLIVKDVKLINFSSIRSLYEEEVITFSKNLVQKEIER